MIPGGQAGFGPAVGSFIIGIILVFSPIFLLMAVYLMRASFSYFYSFLVNWSFLGGIGFGVAVSAYFWHLRKTTVQRQVNRFLKH